MIHTQTEDFIKTIVAIRRSPAFAEFRPSLEEQIEQIYTGIRQHIGWSKDVSGGKRQALLAQTTPI